MRIEILGIPVDCVTQKEALRRIEGFLRSEGQFHVTTPNPEMLVEARRNGAFRTVLRNAALNLPDGTGLVWAMRRAVKRSSAVAGSAVGRGNEVLTARKTLQHHKRGLLRYCATALPATRVTGADTMIALCKTTTERVFLLGAAPGVAETAAERLKERNPNLNVTGTFAGSPDPQAGNGIIRRINEAGPAILFVAFGAPAQDLWIARNLPGMPTIKVAMGVGGAFDFIAGKQKRAPRLFQQAGVEWLWRLIREPRRIRRILNAVVVFPWMVATRNGRAYPTSP